MSNKLIPKISICHGLLSIVFAFFFQGCVGTIEEKIVKARMDLELLKSSYMNNGNNGTEDTSPTFKAFEETFV